MIDDKFSKPFKTYLGKDTVYNFINNMIEESKYWSDVMKNIELELVIPNGIERYMNFTVNNKLSFIGSFQFLSSSLDTLV